MLLVRRKQSSDMRRCVYTAVLWVTYIPVPVVQRRGDRTAIESHKTSSYAAFVGRAYGAYCCCDVKNIQDLGRAALRKAPTRTILFNGGVKLATISAVGTDRKLLLRKVSRPASLDQPFNISWLYAGKVNIT